MKQVKAGILFLGIGLIGIVLYTSLHRPVPSLTIQSAGGGSDSSKGQPSPTAPTGTLATEEAKSRVMVARDAYLDQSIEAFNTQIKGLVCARKLEYSNKAAEWNRQTGGSTEKWLLDRLSVQVGDIAKDQRAFVGFNGSAEQQAIARPMTLDNIALLLAVQDLYQGRQGKDCSVNLAAAVEATGQFQAQANTYAALRNQRLEEIKKQNGGAVNADANSGK